VVFVFGVRRGTDKVHTRERERERENLSVGERATDKFIGKKKVLSIVVFQSEYTRSLTFPECRSRSQ
jgi:hypothetical protein